MNGRSNATLWATTGAVADALDQLADHVIGGRGAWQRRRPDAVNLVADDRPAGVDERLEAIDDLAVADAQRSDVDDVPVLGLHRGRLEVEHDELGVTAGEARPDLGDRCRPSDR